MMHQEETTTDQLRQRLQEQLGKAGTKLLSDPMLVQLFNQWSADKTLLGQTLAAESAATANFAAAIGALQAAQTNYGNAADNLATARENVSLARSVLDTDMQAILAYIVGSTGS